MAPGELVARGRPAVVRLVGHGRQQDLLDRPLDRAQREALLEQAVGSPLIKRLECPAQQGGRRGAGAALLRQRDRGGRVVGLRERLPQRFDLEQLVVAVPARRSARSGE